MALRFIPIFLRSQLLVTIPYPTAPFSGQTIIVTGSNTGLGLEAAKHIARLGAARLILAVRNVSKGEKAAETIAENSSLLRSRIEVWQLDMSDITSIRNFAERASKLGRLDAAILNAGILLQNKWEDYAGIEAHLSVNVLGTSLLSFLLLSTLKRSAKQTGLTGRLAFVGSDLMMMASLKELDTKGSIIDKLNTDRGADPGSRYALSKLLVAFTVRDLAHRFPVAETNVIINDLTPGACQSDIFREDYSLATKAFMQIANRLISRTCEVGSRTLVYGIGPSLPKEAHGAFLMDNKVFDAGPVVSSPEARELAVKWNTELLQYLEKISPGCTQSSDVT